MISERAAGYLWHHFDSNDGPWLEACKGTRAYCKGERFTAREALRLMKRIKRRVDGGLQPLKAIHQEILSPPLRVIKKKRKHGTADD
jgi:hypothetical protein